MSASKKKQLHSESTEKLTERQILEQKGGSVEAPAAEAAE